ncbi:MAG: flippase [Patescibacteria group bacterium]
MFRTYSKSISEQSILKQQVAKNTIISFLGKIISSLIGLISIAFIARELGPDGFGSYNTAIAFLYIFSVFADFGLYQILTREISKDDVAEHRIVSYIFTTRVLLLFFFYTISFIVVYFIPVYPNQIKLGIMTASLGFVFLSLSQVLMGIFQKYLKTLLPAIADISARIIQLVLVVYLYQRESSFLDFLLIFVIGAFVNFIFVYIFTKRYVSFSFLFNRLAIYNILRESWPLAVSSILVLIYFKGDTLIISFLKDAKDVGIYNIAYKVIENIIFFPAMFVGLVMPLLSNYFILNTDNFKKVFQKAFDFLNIISIPIICGAFYLAPEIINIIGGSGFEESVLTLRVLIFSIFFIFLGALFGSTIIAINKQKQVMFAYGISAIFNISANIYFINKYSYIGASFVNVITEFLATILMFFIIYRSIKYIPKVMVLFKATISSLLMTLALFLFPVQNIIILFFVGLFVYFSVMYIVRGISKDDFLLFFKK